MFGNEFDHNPHLVVHVRQDMLTSTFLKPICLLSHIFSEKSDFILMVSLSTVCAVMFIYVLLFMTHLKHR